MNPMLIFLSLSTASIIHRLKTANVYKITDDVINRVVSNAEKRIWSSARYMYLCKEKKAEPLIYMLEDGARLTHVEFDGRISYVEGMKFTDSSHGTSVGSKIIGKTLSFARNSQLTVLSTSGYYLGSPNNTSNTASFLKEIRKLTGRPIILNISASLHRDYCNFLKELIDLDITIITSAGNMRQNTARVPKCQVDDLIIVGSTNGVSKLHEFLSFSSNYGKSVTLFAPGEYVRVADNESDNSYAMSSGTSFSAPLVAGLAVKLLEQKPDASPREMKEQLIRMAVDGKIALMPPESTNRFLQVDLSSEKAACNLWEQEGGVYLGGL